MEIKIGVVHSPKELELEVDGTPEDVARAVDEALQQELAVLWLVDAKGRRVGVPAARLAYIELEADHDAKRVGFRPA
jgi:hypothetical protein